MLEMAVKNRALFEANQSYRHPTVCEREYTQEEHTTPRKVCAGGVLDLQEYSPHDDSLEDLRPVNCYRKSSFLSQANAIARIGTRTRGEPPGLPNPPSRSATYAASLRAPASVQRACMRGSSAHDVRVRSPRSRHKPS